MKSVSKITQRHYLLTEMCSRLVFNVLGAMEEEVLCYIINGSLAWAPQNMKEVRGY